MGPCFEPFVEIIPTNYSRNKLWTEMFVYFRISGIIFFISSKNMGCRRWAESKEQGPRKKKHRQSQQGQVLDPPRSGQIRMSRDVIFDGFSPSKSVIFNAKTTTHISSHILVSL